MFKRNFSKQFFFLILMVVCFLGNRAFGQGGTTGAISGLVTDSTGAVVGGANITATRVATGVVTKTTTNGSGVYTLPYLQLGEYQVRVSAPGMKESVVSGILVDEGNISRADTTLQVGSVGQIVQVKAAAPLMEADTSTIDATVDRKLIDDLPSVVGGGTRDATAIVNILPGVQTPGNTTGQSYGSQFGVNIGGGRQFTTEFQMDGMTVAYQGVTGGVPLDMRPDYDLVSEVKVQEGVPSAEFGRTSGGVVTYLSRSGTNDLHGNASVFIKNTVFDARPYNSKTKAVDQQWEMPLSLGGPVYIPKLYNGRNKTFFFFNYTAFRQRSGGAPGTVTVPTALERGGNFSDLSTPIYDPTTGQQFPGNIIPTDRFSKVAAAINAFYPQPTSSGLTNNYTGLTPSFTKADDIFARGDHTLTATNHLTVTYRHRSEPSVLAEGAPFGPVLSGDSAPKSMHQEIVSDDWALSHSVVNHIAFGDIGFTVQQNSNPLDPKYWIPVPNSYDPAFPSFCFTNNGYAGIGMGLGGCAVAQHNYEEDRSRDLQDTVFWSLGNHSLKFGARYLWFQAATGELDSRNGVYQFSASETAQVVNGSVNSNTGNSFASFLLGRVDYATMTLADVPDYHSQYFGVYAQDNWRVNPKLNINYGLRWDVEPPPYDTQNRLSEMNPTVPNPGAGNYPGAYVFAPQQHVRTFVPTYFGAWAPRLGLAYSVTPTIVVRASAGILLAPPNNDNGTSPIDATGFSGIKTQATTDGGITPGLIWDQGWTNVIRPPSFDPSIANAGNANIMAHNANHWPITNMWSLDVQKSFARDFLVDVSYVGQSSHRIANPNDPINQVNPSYLSLGSLLTKPISDPAVIAAGFKPPYVGFPATATLAQALKPFPQYNTVNNVGNKIFNSSYNALYIKADKRFSNGFQYLVSYTFSKTITDAPLNVFGYVAGAGGPQDTYNLKAEKFLAPYDIPQTLVTSFTYALPWGPGRPFINHGLFSNIVGGFAVSGILEYAAGTPVALQVPNSLPIGNGRLNAEYLGGPTEVSHGSVRIAQGSAPGTVTLNRSAFDFPKPFTFGNAYILPSTRTVGYKSENISIFKRETFRDRYILEVRFDLINMPNRKDPGGLITDLTNPGFGQYSGNNIGPRNGQLGVKISF